MKAAVLSPCERAAFSRPQSLVAEDFIHRANLLDVAVCDNGDAVANLFDDTHLVRDDDDCHAELLVQLLEQSQDRLRRGRVKALVPRRKKHLRAGGEGAGDGLRAAAGRRRAAPDRPVPVGEPTYAKAPSRVKRTPCAASP